MNLWAVFIVGLTSGGLSCLAMQGGLLTSMIANMRAQDSTDTNPWRPVVLFLSSKLIAHVLLGGLLGLLGSMLSLSQPVQLTFQVLAALFMLATAMNLLQVHPAFRYVTLQTPKFLQRLVRHSSKSRQWFAPVVLGSLTVFIPCGVTQAMEVVAINSGNMLTGALTLGVFVLGTSPVFAALGVATGKLSEQWQARFTKVVAYALIAMAVYGLNGALVVLNFPITLQSIARPVRYFFSSDRFQPTPIAPTDQGVQRVAIQVLNNGYSPNYVRVRVGQPVELALTTQETYSCAVAFQLKEFGIKVFLEPSETRRFTFTPQRKGRFTFSCSMGMYTGTFEVI